MNRQPAWASGGLFARWRYDIEGFHLGSTAVEKCCNCGCEIGDLETPDIWGNAIVCAKCRQKLSGKLSGSWAFRVAAAVAVVFAIGAVVILMRRLAATLPARDEYGIYLESVNPVLNDARRLESDWETNTSAEKLREDLATALVALQKFGDTDKANNWRSLFPSDADLSSSIAGYKAVVDSIDRKIARRRERADENEIKLNLIVGDEFGRRLGEITQNTAANLEDIDMDQETAKLQKEARKYLETSESLIAQRK